MEYALAKIHVGAWNENFLKISIWLWAKEDVLIYKLILTIFTMIGSLEVKNTYK